MPQTIAPPPRQALRKILVVDDQADIREALRLLLKPAGYGIHMADSPAAALAAAASGDHDLILIDMNYASDTTSGQEGLALLDRLRTIAPGVPVVAMTGWSTIELAVQAMQHGACDFVTKPWDAYQLLELFAKHLQSDRLATHLNSARDHELAIARRVQRKLLPPTHFTAAGLDIHCVCLPAGEVGGDLYDFFALDAHSVAFLLGDVCGKGMGAALLVATLQAAIRSHRELAAEPAQLLDRVNRLFFQSTRPEHFATLFLGVYHSLTGTIRYVNCGHPAPVLLRRDGSETILAPNALILGAFENCVFAEEQIAFVAGDRLILFSDGLSECEPAEKDEAWLQATIKKLAGGAPGDIAGPLAISATGVSDQIDDITVVDIRVA